MELKWAVKQVERCSSFCYIFLFICVRLYYYNGHLQCRQRGWHLPLGSRAWSRVTCQGHPGLTLRWARGGRPGPGSAGLRGPCSATCPPSHCHCPTRVAILCRKVLGLIIIIIIIKLLLYYYYYYYYYYYC